MKWQQKLLERVKNPWAICTDSIENTAGPGRKSWSNPAKSRYERCVKKVKRK